MKIKTMLAVIAGALGLAATAEVTLPTGTSFEGNEAEVIQPGAIVDDATGLWSSADTEAALEVKEYGTGEQYVYSVDQSNHRLKKFDEGAQDKYLSVKTKFGSPLLRSEEVAMGDGLYFDSLVKFTACDEAPTATSYDVEGGDKAKLIVWAFEDEDDGGSVTLNVTAGNDSTYTVLEEFDCSQWHRLTIKSFATANKEGLPKPAFAIFVDGVAVSCADAKADFTEADLTDIAKVFYEANNLFLSRDPNGIHNQTITSVGFDGQGAIDDVALTDDAPIPTAADPVFVTIKKGAGVASFSYNGTKYMADANVQEAASYTVTDVTFEDGYFGDEEQDLGADMTVKASKKAVSINGKNYATIQEAIAAAAVAETPEGAVIKIESALTPTESIEISEGGTQTIVIDLNGKTIDGSALSAEDSVIVAMGALTIQDSAESQTGKVIAPADGYAVTMDCEKRSITGGTFVGLIDAGLTYEGPFITGGWYLTNVGQEGLVANGYEAKVDESHDGYYKVDVKKSGWAIYLAGAGTQEAPYQIADEQDLIELATYMHTTADFPTTNTYFQQTANIALTETWAGIGKYGKDSTKNATAFAAGAFQGTYDGGNYSITGLKLKSDYAGGTATNKYIGFFFSTYNAEIKNVKFGIANYGWDKGKSIAQNVGAGIVVGTSWNTTFTNIEILKGTDAGTDEFYGTHAISAFAGFTTGANTFTGCTNNVNLTENRGDTAKVAGFSACNQDNSPVLTLVDCVNNGNITSTKADFAAGFAAYADVGSVKLTNCSNTGTLGTGVVEFVANAGAGKGTAENLGGCKGLGLVAPTKNGTSIGFAFAQVNDSVLTFVADSAAVAGANLKVMLGGKTVTLANVGDKITLDMSFATATVNTTATDAYVKKDGNVYTVTEKDTPTITVTLDNPIVEYTAGMTFPTPKVEGGTPDKTTWNPAAIVEPDAGKTNEYVVTVTVAATTTTKAGQGQATLKVWKAAPAADLPSDVAGGSDQQKADYAEWAKNNGVSGTGNENAAAFALGVTAADILAAGGDVTKAVQAKLDAKITSEMVAALVAGTAGQGLDALKAEYPNADFKFVPATELTSTDTAKFFKLQVSFKPANN